MNIRKAKIVGNLGEIHRRIRVAAERVGRDARDIQLLLATKTVSAADIKIALGMGETLIGENKVQELAEKNDELARYRVDKHFIGHLQSNKIKQVLRYVNCIQSIDSWSLAEALDKQLRRESRILPIMVQVNTSFEESKFGLQPEDVTDFIHKIKTLSSLQIVGLMTIGLFDSAAEKVRPSFTRLRQIKEDIISEGILDSSIFKHLSMGMSGDLEVAIEEGATIIRVGTAIFGERQYPDSYYWNENIK